MPEIARPGMDIRHYLTILRRRRWIIILSVLAVAGSALGFSLLQTPVYEAHARVLIEPRQSLYDTSFADYIDPARIQTEIQVLGSEPVSALVKKELGSTPGISASVVGSTAVIDVAAQSTEPAVAARVANAYARSYIEYRGQQAVESLVAATGELQRKITELDAQIAEADKVAAATNPPRPPGAPVQLTPEQESLRSQKSAFKQKLDQINVDVSIRNGGAQLVSAAAEPSAPVRPTTRRNVALGLLVGLVVGTALAFLVDQLDDSIKTQEDIERMAGGVPVLAVIPRAVGWKNRAEPKVLAQVEPSSPVAEAYRSLRTSIRFFGVDRPMRTILITSPSAGDGKTTTIANLAIVLARAGQRVTVVSCDLRRPRVHDFLGVSNTVGFTSVLVGTASLSAALQAVPDESRLRVMASGPLAPNPSELLSSRRAEEVLRALQAESDVVLIDCPPVLPVTDAVVLSSRVDATLLVATAGTTTGKQLSRSVEMLHRVGAPLVGLVFNGARPEAAYGYAYGYYRQEASPKRSRQAARNGSSGNGSARKPAETTPTEASSN